MTILAVTTAWKSPRASRPGGRRASLSSTDWAVNGPRCSNWTRSSRNRRHSAPVRRRCDGRAAPARRWRPAAAELAWTSDIGRTGCRRASWSGRVIASCRDRLDGSQQGGAELRLHSRGETAAMGRWSFDTWHPSLSARTARSARSELMAPRARPGESYGRGQIYDLSFTMDRDIPVPGFHGYTR